MRSYYQQLRQLPMRWIIALLIALGLPRNDALLGQSRPCRALLWNSQSAKPTLRSTIVRMAKTMEPEEIKQQLEEYLQKRRELNADELAIK